ncbi:hypothetical protein [Teredinibacter turnerae]|uniref:hypothetical protein n=1 Tax=Teredinibacter turnerae TaxID=2426 RepID=UPI0003F603E4|nr:hypothetical protein [Teredinibacter turnerae]
MKIKWTSQRGKERSYNNDAVALGYKGHFLIVVLVDAADNRTPRTSKYFQSPTKRLASFWADSCLQKILKLEALSSEEAIIHALSDQQKKLRSHYLHDIASYGVLTVNIEKGDIKWLYTGDCRFGLLTNAEKVQWLDKPHRLNELPLYLPRECDSHEVKVSKQNISEHTLTQCLNARRFSSPTLVKSKICIDASEAETTSIIIGTDGYWSEHLHQGIAMGDIADDASFLAIKCGEKALSIHSDSPNLLVIYS